MEPSLNVFIAVAWLAFLVSCGQKQEKPEESRKKESRYAAVLKKYREIRFDTLQIIAGEDYESDTSRLKGMPLTAAEGQLFPEEVAHEHSNEYPGLFACFKFPIGNGRMGLLTRTPSIYLPTSIKLFILDMEKDTITDYFELAESLGDAGDFSTKTSWLYYDSSRQAKAFTYVEEGTDNSVNDPADTTIDYWHYYYLIGIKGNKHDTLSSDSGSLVKQFRHLVTSAAASSQEP